MRIDRQNNDIIKKCRDIDFSNESINKDKNLEILKRRITEIQNGGDTAMKKTRKPFATVIVAAALLACLSMTVYGEDIVTAIKSIFIGEHARYDSSIERGSKTLPDGLKGMLFDAEGNELEEIVQGETFYNADGEEVYIVQNDENGEVEYSVKTVEENEDYSEAKPQWNTLEFYDLEKGLSYFIDEVRMPEYLPEGYNFEKISLQDNLLDENGKTKILDIFYSNGNNGQILCMIRFMDAETAFTSNRGYEPEEIIINGHQAVIIGFSLHIQIGDVLYEFIPSADVDVDELIKIAETMVTEEHAKTLPDELEGMMFDAEGKELTKIVQGETFYNGDGDEARIIQNDVNGEVENSVMPTEEYEDCSEAEPQWKALDFYNLEEGLSYFIDEVRMPEYLPEGYRFEKISLQDNLLDENGKTKILDIFYSNGNDGQILCMIRFMDEETAFTSNRGYEPEEININGHQAVVIGFTLHIQIGDILYEFIPSADIDVNELIKITETM